MKRSRRRKLDPKNQLFLVISKIKPQFRSGISIWIVCFLDITLYNNLDVFLYQRLKEIDWIPTVNQVKGTLPAAFREIFPTIYAITDGSEVFLETPSDLAMQSSTWSNINIKILRCMHPYWSHLFCFSSLCRMLNTHEYLAFWMCLRTSLACLL